MTPMERLRKRIEIVRDKLDGESDVGNYRDGQSKVEILEWVLEEIERITKRRERRQL